jgi:hypothetical protein
VRDLDFRNSASSAVLSPQHLVDFVRTWKVSLAFQMAEPMIGGRSSCYAPRLATIVASACTSRFDKATVNVGHQPLNQSPSDLDHHA